MELRQLLNELKRQIRLIVIITLLFGGLGLAVSLTWPVSYRATQQLYVQKDAAVGSDYNYDGYYAQQAAEQYTDTVVGLFKGAAFWSEAVTRSGVTVSGTIPKDSLLVEKIAPQIIEVSVTWQDQQSALNLCDAWTQIMTENLPGLALSQTNRYQVQALTAAPQVEKVALTMPIAVASGLVLGALLATFGSAVLYYLRTDE